MEPSEPTARIQTKLSLLYGLGLVTWFAVFGALVGYRRAARRPILFVGLMLGVMVLGVAWSVTRFQTDKASSIADAETGEVERNAFYMTSGLFALGTMLSALSRDTVRKVLPMFMAVIFFVICTVMPPYIIPRGDPELNLYMKHSSAVLTCIGVATCAVLLVSVYRNIKR